MMKRSIFALSFAMLMALTATAFALPSVEQVQSEVAQGHFAQAETMMREVVAAKPDSARAHYVLAEILAHERQFTAAAEQAQRASALDPALTFTQAAKFRAFESLLDRERAAERAQVGSGQAPALSAAAPPASTAARGLPGWVWVLGLGAVALLVVRALSARRTAPVGPSYAPAMPGGGMGAYGPGSPAGPVPGAGGSGLLGTGLAVAGGVAAGMLAERLIEGHTAPAFGNNAAGLFPGLDPGSGNGGWSDDSAARDLTDRPVDFGNGGDNWDSGGADLGGSGGSDGW